MQKKRANQFIGSFLEYRNEKNSGPAGAVAPRDPPFEIAARNSFLGRHYKNIAARVKFYAFCAARNLTNSAVMAGTTLFKSPITA